MSPELPGRHIFRTTAPGKRALQGMTRKLIAVVATSSALVWLTGCGGGAVPAIRSQAASDLSCPAANIKVDAPSASGQAPTESGAYYAEGCGKRWRYTVGCNIGGYCPSPQGVDVKEVLTKQAAFDLTCGRDQLAIADLNADTFGVAGCGRKVSYVLLCEYRTCRAVQNTQSQ